MDKKLLGEKLRKTIFALIFVLLFLIACSQLQTINNVAISEPNWSRTTFEYEANASCHIVDGLPDKECSPGLTLNISLETACTSGYSATVRNVSQKTKNEVFKEYGIVRVKGDSYEIDHIVPLSLGGSNDIKNLFPQAELPHPGFRDKDRIEVCVRKMVCEGKVSLDDAQQMFADDWTKGLTWC